MISSILVIFWLVARFKWTPLVIFGSRLVPQHLKSIEVDWYQQIACDGSSLADFGFTDDFADGKPCFGFGVFLSFLYGMLCHVGKLSLHRIPLISTAFFPRHLCCAGEKKSQEDPRHDSGRMLGMAGGELLRGNWIDDCILYIYIIVYTYIIIHMHVLCACVLHMCH